MNTTKTKIRRTNGGTDLAGSVKAELTDEVTEQVGSTRSSLVKDIIQSIGQSIDLSQIYSSPLQENSEFRVIIPQDALKALSEGSANWISAKDGSGILPVIYKDGKAYRQVRLEINKTNGGDIALIGGKAITTIANQLVLEKIISKIDKIGDQVNYLIKEVQTGWKADIFAALETYQTCISDPGPRDVYRTNLNLAAMMARKGKQHGIISLNNCVDSLPPLKKGWRCVLPPYDQAHTVDKLLDEAQDILGWTFQAAQVLAQIEMANERSETAANVMRETVAQVSPYVEKLHSYLEHSTFSKSREEYWSGAQMVFIDSEDQEGELVLTYSAREVKQLMS